MNKNKSLEKYVSLAFDHNTSSKTLDELSNNENWQVRYFVAKNKNTSSETLDKLSKDEYWGVRESVASNLNTRPETLDEFVNVARAFKENDMNGNGKADEMDRSFH